MLFKVSNIHFDSFLHMQLKHNFGFDITSIIDNYLNILPYTIYSYLNRYMTIHEDTKLQKCMNTNMFEEWELKLDENSDNIITNTLYNNNATPEDIFYNGKCNCNTGLCVFKKIVFNIAYFHIKRFNLDINDICISYNLKGVSDVQISEKEKSGKSLLLTTFTYMDDLQNPSAFTYIDKHNYKFKNYTSFPLFLCRSKKYKHISLDSTTSYHCMNFKAYNNNNKYSDMLIIKL